MENIRLLMVDDHEVVRLGLRTLMERSEGIDVVGEAGTAEEAVRCAMQLRPDVVLLDVRLPDGNGVEAARAIRRANRDVKIIFLTSFEDEEAILAAVSGVAHGYVLKEIGAASLVGAIRTVMNGQLVIVPAIGPTGRFLANRGRPSVLTGQEERVIQLVAEGRTNKEIAVSLDLSEKTVRNYLTRVFRKLGFTRRAQAAAYFVRGRANAAD